MIFFPTIKVFATDFHIATFDEIIAFIAKSIESPELIAIDTSNTMVAGLAATDSCFKKALLSFDIRVPDSMPLVWYMRAVGGDITATCYAPELLQRIWATFATRNKIFVIGADDNTKQLFEARFPKPQNWVTRLIDPMAAADIERLSLELSEAQADIILIGLSCPKSYYFVEKIKPCLKRGVVVHVGGSFDLVSGRQKITPYPIQRLGLGWLYRLCCEPGRLWKRYLKFNSLFMLLACRNAWSDRRRNQAARAH